MRRLLLLLVLLLATGASADVSDFDYSGIPDTGELPVTRTACINLLAKDGICNTCTSGAQPGTEQHTTSMNFDTTAVEKASWEFDIPANFAGTSAEVQILWYSNHADCSGEAANDDVCFVIDGAGSADGEAWLDKAATATAAGLVDVCTGESQLNVTSAASFTHTMTAGDRAYITIIRDVENAEAICGIGTDSYAQDAKVIGLRFCHEVDNVFSGE
jgi:hypothetical protein